MAISLASLKRSVGARPIIMVVYGPKGVGKTTFAAGAPAPVLLAVEDGVGRLDVPHWGIPSWDDLMQAIGSLLGEPHDFKTAIVDSLDWLEPLVWGEACRRNNWTSIEQPGYGKGYIEADSVWRDFVDGMKALRDERGMSVVQLAHEEIKNFASPEADPFDMYRIKLHKRGSAILQEHADAVGFLSFDTFTTTTESGFNKKVVRAVGSGARLLRLEARPAFEAKNRLGLPAEIRLPTTPEAWNSPQAIWQAFADHLPK